MYVGMLRYSLAGCLPSARYVRYIHTYIPTTCKQWAVGGQPITRPAQA